MQTQRRVAAGPQTKSANLDFESTNSLLLSASSTAIYYCYFAKNW